MENMDTGLIVPKWVRIVWLKIPQMPQNLSAQVQKFWISIKKGFINTASVVRVCYLGFGFFVKLTQEGTGST